MTTESTLRVSIDGASAAAGAASVEASLKGMNAAGQQSTGIFDTLTSTLQKMGSSAFGGINSALQAMGSVGQNSINSVTSALNNMANAAHNAAGALGGGGGRGGSGGGVLGALGALGGAASSIGRVLRDLIPLDLILGFAKTIFDVSNRLQGFISTMSVVTGSLGAARDELTYIFSVANKWGADVDAITGSYAKLAAAAKGTALEGNGVRDVFEAVTQASVALHLSTQDTTLVFFALQQMVSKGKVSMEELRKQLAERFPGAIQIAADSLGVTVDVMEKMVKKGEVLAADFLPKFAKGIEAAFGDAATLASRSLLAEINRLKNGWEAFLMKLAESGVIEKASEAVTVLTAMLNGNSDVALMLGEVISRLVGHVTDFLRSLKPGDVENFFNTLAKVAGLVVNIFGGLAKLTAWLIDLLGPMVSIVGGALVDSFTALATILTSVTSRIGSLGKLFSGEISFRDWIFGANSAAEATNKFGMSNDDAKDRMARLAKEKERANEIDQRNLKNTQNAYADSMRMVDVKTKEISVTQRLNEINLERNNLIAISEDSTIDIKERTQAMNQVIALNKEYSKLQNEANKESSKMSKDAAKDLRDQVKASESLTATLEKQQYALTHTRIEEELRAVAISVSTIKSKQLRDATFAYMTSLVATNDELRRAAEEEKAIQKIYENHIESYDKQIEAADKALLKAKEENEQIGKTKAQIELLKVARTDEAIVKLESTLASIQATNVCTEEAEKIKVLIERLKELRAVEADNANKIAAVDYDKQLETARLKLENDFKKTANSIGDSLTDALLRGFESGASFAENLKNTMVNMFKTMILKPIIQPIVSDAVGSLSQMLGIKVNPDGSGFSFTGGGNPGQSSGGLNSITSMFSGGGSGIDLMGILKGSYTNSFMGKVFSGYFGGETNSSFMGPPKELDYGQLFKEGVSQALAGAGIGAAIGSLGAELFGNERNKQGMQIGGTIGGSIGMMVGGPLGALVGSAIGTAIGSLFKSGGGPKGGGFFASGETPGITGTDDSGRRWFTPNDQDSAVKKIVQATAQSYSEMLKSLGGTGSATFALGFDTDPKGTAPNRTHTGVFMNGQQVYDSQQSDLGRDPARLQEALETESKRALLAALKASDLPDYIAEMLASLDPKTMDSGDIDKILETIQALKMAVDVFGELGGQLKELDPTQVQALVDAFGGLEEFMASFQFLDDNMVTSAEKQARAQTKLDEAFKDLNIDVPQTHEAFMDLLESIDLTTDEGRALYTTIANLAPTFVELHGTADEAAEAISAAAEAFADLVSQGQEFFDENFLSDSERQAQKVATAWTVVHKAWGDTAVQLHALGFDHIPTTNEGFKELVESIDRATPAGEALYQRLIIISPAIWDLNDALAATNQELIDATAFFKENFYSDNEKAASRIKAAWVKVHAAWTQFGGQLMELGLDHIPTTNQAFRELVESLDPESPLYQALILLSPTIFQLNQDIETLGDTANGVSPELQRLRDSIRDFLDSLKLSDLSPLTPEQKLMEAQDQYLNLLNKAKTGDLDALAKLPDAAKTYLEMARDFYASSQQYTDIFNSVTSALEQLITANAPTPEDVVDLGPINAALPPEGHIASNKDIEDLANRIIDGLRAHASETVEATYRSGSRVASTVEEGTRFQGRGKR
jgi:tape measure domain-containing protein